MRYSESGTSYDKDRADELAEDPDLPRKETEAAGREMTNCCCGCLFWTIFIALVFFFSWYTK